MYEINRRRNLFVENEELKIRDDFHNKKENI